MGYFNIFYKITRIIDMLTRKRNRKAIMVILIIIAVVFLYHNKVNAQEDTLVYNQGFTHMRVRVSTGGVVQYGEMQDANNVYRHFYSIVFPVKEGFTYKAKCTSSNKEGSLYVGYVSDLTIQLFDQYSATSETLQRVFLYYTL